jgi:sugar transferase (PEP-CTERM system associated)
MLMARAIRRSTAFIASETALIFGSVLLMAHTRAPQAGMAVTDSAMLLPKALLIALGCQLCLYARDLYEGRVSANRQEVFVRLFQALGVTSIVFAIVYTMFPSLVIGRGVFVGAVTLAAVLILGWRGTLAWVRTQVGPHERLLVVGTNAGALALASELCDRSDLGVDIVGFVEPEALGRDAFGATPVIGTVEDIPAIVRARSVDRVVVSLSDARGKLPMDKLLEMKLDGVQFAHLASVYEEYTGKIAIDNLRPSWLIFSSGFNKTRLLKIAKRTLDITAALGGLVLSGPIQLMVAAAVRLTSRGPVIYRQQRVGLDGQIFVIRKFRSMRENAEAATGPVWARPKDDRVTPIGAFLRRTRLDELPQLWNVLLGDMSLVGPRPERPEFVATLTRGIQFYGQRHVVKPGVTGWAQVRYTYGASDEDAMQKLQYDLFYIKHMSIWLDLFIMLRTVKVVLLGRNAC